MQIDIQEHDDYAILSPKGELDIAVVPDFQEKLENLIQRGISCLVLNFRLVRFINSTALGAIIKAHKRCKTEGGDLVLAKASPFVREIVKKLGIDQLVPLFEDEEQAVKHLIKLQNAREFSPQAALGEGKVLVSFTDETRRKQVGNNKALVGRVSNVDGNRVQFLWAGRAQGLSPDQARVLFAKGTQAELRFQLKLVKKGYIDATAEFLEAERAGDEDVKVTAQFKKITTEDRAALNQFAEDMAFLKRQLPK